MRDLTVARGDRLLIRDLSFSVGPGEAILFCPANHSVPRLVSPHPGADGYEAMASCLASPEVRARTESRLIEMQSEDYLGREHLG